MEANHKQRDYNMINSDSMDMEYPIPPTPVISYLKMLEEPSELSLEPSEAYEKIANRMTEETEVSQSEEDSPRMKSNSPYRRKMSFNLSRLAKKMINYRYASCDRKSHVIKKQKCVFYSNVRVHDKMDTKWNRPPRVKCH